MAAPVVSMNGRWGGKLREQNLDIMSGDDVTIEVTVLNIDGSAKDLTSATVVWTLSKRPGTNAQITISGTLTDASNGVLQVAITGTGDYRDTWYQEIEVTESGGAVWTVLRGRVLLNRDTVNA